MPGATFTEIAMWIFYPFNGPGKAKLGAIDIPLGRIAEHIGDWEHLTLRISSFNGILYKIYFSVLEFQNGSNKPVAYSALNGHPFYPKPGLVLKGFADIGIRNETSGSNIIFDTGLRYSVVSAKYLEPAIIEPPWLNYSGEWDPKISYDVGVEVSKMGDSLSGNLNSAFESLVKILPKEVYGEEGQQVQR